MLPGIHRPLRNPEIFSAILRIERLERLSIDQDFGGWSRRIGTPGDRAVLLVQRRDPTSAPNSAPELPTRTLSFTTNGAIVMVSPFVKSPSFTFHFNCPLPASTANVWASIVL